MIPEHQALVAIRTIQGVPGCKIAQELGVHESTVSRTKARPEIKSRIEDEFASLMNRGLRPARKTLCRVAAMGNCKGVDKDILKLSIDASKAIIAQANGQPGTIINTLIQINEAPQQTNELSGITQFLQAQWQDKVIDVQAEQVDTKYPPSLDIKYPGEQADCSISIHQDNQPVHNEMVRSGNEHDEQINGISIDIETRGMISDRNAHTPAQGATDRQSAGSDLDEMAGQEDSPA